MGGAVEPARGSAAPGLSPQTPLTPLNPRAAAHRILAGVRVGTLSDLAASRILPDVDPVDRGLALDIAFGCLRLRARLDVWIEAFADRPLRRIDPVVRDWLRIGVYQLTELRTPDHAAVGETVRAARAGVGRKRVGYVNAVLRAVARGRDGTDPFPAPDADPVAHLCAWGSHPEWLLRRWLARWPLADVRRLVERQNRPPDVVLRMLDGDDPAPPEGVRLAPVPGWPRSFTLAEGAPAAALAGLRAVVQDPAASSVVDYVGRRPAGPVLDVCAAPGTKAVGLAAEYGVPVVALDISRGRLARLAAPARRLKLPVSAAVADARRLPVAEAGTVLADVPCTGTGVLRRRADARWRLDERGLGALVALQREIMDACADAVRPGGLLVYSTCSLEREENEGQVDAFLERRLDYRREPPDAAPDGCLTPRGDLFVRPWVTDTDGAYAARLRRVA
ncbi:RsmB/NOP family class I SAM-dependent RNA methyltransferase [Candidatus Palauibacter sp.]|uniref:RsmB/NOP family class I SAM-dependent RNA methyltransferase n=1 Tax=Candidatus Palauibacter sp. TaxID=3101350 RepID=UPI003B5A9F04